MTELILKQLLQALISICLILLLSFLKIRITNLLKRYPLSTLTMKINSYYTNNNFIFSSIIIIIIIIMLINLLITIEMYTLNSLEDNIETLLYDLLIYFISASYFSHSFDMSIFLIDIIC